MGEKDKTTIQNIRGTQDDTRHSLGAGKQTEKTKNLREKGKGNRGHETPQDPKTSQDTSRSLGARK